MLEFLWQFFYNMKLPMSAVALIVAMVGLIVIRDSRQDMASFAKASEDYAIMEWRIWTCVNVIAIVSLLWLLVASVPSPTFKKAIEYRDRVRTVEKKVPVKIYERGVRVVYHSPTYPEAYQLCVEASGGYTEAKDKCHAQAMQASAPPGHFKMITRTVTVRDPYESLFRACMGSSDYVNIDSCRGFALRQAPKQ